MATGQIAGITVTGVSLAHAASALAFLILVLLLLAGWRRGQLGIWLIAASAITFAWLGLSAYNLHTGAGLDRAVASLETLRSAAWLTFLLKYLFVNWPRSWSPVVRRCLFLALALVSLGTAGLTMGLPTWVRYFDADQIIRMALAGNLTVAIAGLYLAENLFRNSDEAQRWRIKFLCFAIAGMFALDFIIYAEALLFHRLNSGLYGARGLALALIVPLIAVSTVRNTDWTVDVSVSRQVVLHSTTLVGSGIYLLVMSGAGYYVRQFGGDWGPVAQAGFLFAAALTLAITLASGTFRGRLRVFISKHFFSYKYDYRAEWLRVISTMSSPEMGVSLSERVLCAVADIMDSPDGELWLRQDGGSFSLEVAWNRHGSGETQRIGKQVLAFFEHHQWIIDVTEKQSLPGDFQDLELPGWFSEQKRSWLVIPLLHNNSLLALIILGRSRANRTMNWEDFDFLKTVGRQAASYLAAQNSARLLAESRQFQEFNRRFAFVVHDIKNLVSQLTLMLSNAGKFGDNPEFQKDMLETVRGSVEKMNGMLVRLDEGGREAAATRTNISEFLRSLVAANFRGDGSNLSLVPLQGSPPGEDVFAVTDAEKLASVLNHLIDNALDAIDTDGHVTVRYGKGDGRLILEILDDGTGMTREFIDTELFKPFRSTKPAGYGIGAYESRQIIGELGGSLRVESEPGEGTIFRIELPVDGASAATEAAAQ